jgi:hypothetical protein
MTYEYESRRSTRIICCERLWRKQKFPADVADNVVRTVTENSRSAKFTNNSGFKTE